MQPSHPAESEIAAAATRAHHLLDALNEVLYGQRELIELAVIGLRTRASFL